MAERLRFDDRLWNPHAVEELASTHPALFDRLKIWFKGLKELDDAALLKLAAARGPDEVSRWREKGEAALEEARLLAMSLSPVINELKAALAAGPSEELRARLAGLLEAAQQNLRALREDAPRLVKLAIESVPGAGTAREVAAAAIAEICANMEAIAREVGDGTRPYSELHPILGQMRAAGIAFNAALEPLSRADRKELENAHRPRLAAPSGLVCRALYAAKALEAAFDASANEIAGGFDGVATPPPCGWSAGANPMRYEDVRDEDDGSVPAEVSSENFVSWHVIEILTEQEDEFLTDIGYLWKACAAVVNTSEGNLIGHFAPLE